MFPLVQRTDNPPVPYKFVYDGDSRTAGNDVPDSANWWQNRTTGYFKKYAVTSNLAVAGSSIMDWASQGASRITGFDSTRRGNILANGGMGINDIQALGRTAAQLETDYQTYCAAVLGLGFSLVVGTVLTVHNMGGSPFTQLSLFNTWLRANYSTTLGASALVDLDGDPRLTLMDSSVSDDTIHLNPVGQFIWSELYNTALLKVLGK